MDAYMILGICFAIYFVITFKSWSVKHINTCVDCNDVNKEPLYDIVHSKLESKKLLHVKDAYWVGDFLVTLLFSYFLISIYVYKLDVINICVMMLLLQLLKSITSMLTILPDPSGMCREKHGGKETLKILFGNCNDLMFSGHTGFAILCIMILQPYVSRFSFIFLVLYVLILCSITVMTCNHYTIDVVMSFFVAYFIYNVCN